PQEKDKSPYFITIARSLKSSFKEPYGYLFISIPESAISDAFLNYSDEKAFMVVNQEGMVMSHSDQAMIGRTVHYANIPFADGKRVNIEQEDLILLSKELSFGGWKLVSVSNYE